MSRKNHNKKWRDFDKTVDKTGDLPYSSEYHSAPIPVTNPDDGFLTDEQFAELYTSFLKEKGTGFEKWPIDDPAIKSFLRIFMSDQAQGGIAFLSRLGIVLLNEWNSILRNKKGRNTFLKSVYTEAVTRIVHEEMHASAGLLKGVKTEIQRAVSAIIRDANNQSRVKIKQLAAKKAASLADVLAKEMLEGFEFRLLATTKTDGARKAVAEDHPTLPGTVHTFVLEPEATKLQLPPPLIKSIIHAWEQQREAGVTQNEFMAGKKIMLLRTPDDFSSAVTISWEETDEQSDDRLEG